MQLDELKKRIDNLTIGIGRKLAKEIFGYLNVSQLNSDVLQTKISQELWQKFIELKKIINESTDSFFLEEAHKHINNRIFECTVKTDLMPSSEKIESNPDYSEQWTNFEKAALIADNLFDKQKTEIDQLKSQQLTNKASFFSFMKSVFDTVLLPFQKDQFKSFFLHYIFLFNIIETMLPNKTQEEEILLIPLAQLPEEIEKIFQKGEDDKKAFFWFVRELYKISSPADKLKFSTIIPKLGSWFAIEDTLNINDAQQVEIDTFLEKNVQNSYDIDNLINKLINHSKKLTPAQKETLSMAYTETLGNTDRSKRKRTPTTKANETLSKEKMFEKERSEKNSKKKQKIQPEAKATETLSDADRERIITQIRIALDEMWEKNGGKKFGNTHSSKFQTVDKKEYLIFKMLIKPDAPCKTDDEKIAFGKKVELFFKNEFHLQQNTQTNNFKLIEYDFQSKKGIFDLEWNKYCIKEKKNASEKLIGFTLRPKKWEENPGAVIVRGSTTATIEKKLEDLKPSPKKTSIAETSTPFPQDLSKEISESAAHEVEQSEDDEIKDAPPSPELAPKHKQTAPSVVDLEGEINESDEESQKLWEKVKEVAAENEQDEQAIIQIKKLLDEETKQLQEEKQKKHAATKRKIEAELKRQQDKRTKLLSDKERAEQELQKTETKLASYRGGPT